MRGGGKAAVSQAALAATYSRYPDRANRRLALFHRFIRLDRDLHALELDLAMNGRKGGISGVAPDTDAHKALERCLPGRIEKIPGVAEIGFKDRMEIRRIELPSVAGGKTGRDGERSAERYAEMGKVAADSARSTMVS